MTMTKGKRLSALLAATALGGLMAVQPAAAQSLQQLQSQVDALSRQVEDLKKQKAGELKVEAKGAPRFSGDGFNKFKVRGRLMADFGHVGDDGGVVACHLHTAGPRLDGQTVRDVQMTGKPSRVG